jgi:hypothetical protein
VKLVADKRGRLTSAELFRPGTAFNAERLPDGSIRIVELVERTVPIISPRRTKEGFLMLSRKFNRKAVAAAIRADRDAR